MLPQIFGTKNAVSHLIPHGQSVPTPNSPYSKTAAILALALVASNSKEYFLFNKATRANLQVNNLKKNSKMAAILPNGMFSLVGV